MELPQRKIKRIPDYDYNQNGAYFITICTQDRKKILSKISVGTGVLDCPQFLHIAIDCVIINKKGFCLWNV